MAMIPGAAFDNFHWLSLNLVTPVVLLGAWPFPQGRLSNFKHGRGDRWTRLISVGRWPPAYGRVPLFHRAAGATTFDFFRDHPPTGEGARPDLRSIGGGGGGISPLPACRRYFEAKAKRPPGAASPPARALRQGRRAARRPQVPIEQASLRRPLFLVGRARMSPPMDLRQGPSPST